MRHAIDPKIDCVFKASQLASGQEYRELKPTYSIWLLGETLMSTLTGFSEKERECHAYQARQNYLRRQRSIQRRLDELEAAGEQARAAAECEPDPGCALRAQPADASVPRRGLIQ